MISLVITSYNEPEIIPRAIEAALNQKTSHEYEIIVSAPDIETLGVAEKYEKVKTFQDPGRGKMHALNVLFDEIKSDVLILTDGDVTISENTVEDIANLFLNQKMGCVSGRPVPIEDKKTMFGYWANFLFESAHKMRKKSFENGEFIECSGYLFALRNNNVRKIPLDTAEDAVIPYDFWERGYKIGYADKAEVYVRNVDNWKDWIKQKVRTTKAHETLEKYVDTKKTPRAKSFTSEAKGFFDLMNYAENLKELYWSNLLALSRLYMWLLVFYNARIKKFKSVDAWERIESTK
jgi:cellulose synthase/poly-beta-1,6-N-acetylglucosamine synthase-like glycosyltransferase